MNISDRKIRTVALLGAGAVGAYFIWGLTRKTDLSFCVVAEGKRKERLQRDGLVIRGTQYFPKVCTPEEAHGADLLLISVKYDALTALLPAVKQIVGAQTIVMSLLNGVDSEQILSACIPSEQILYAFMKISSERHGNEIGFDPDITQGLSFGEKERTEKQTEPEAGICTAGEKEADETWISPRMRAVAELLDDTGIHYRMCRDIVAQQWFKYAMNIGHNLPQAILGCGDGIYQDSVFMAEVSQTLYEEVRAVAAAYGTALPSVSSVTEKEWIARKAARFSTLQDLDAGRHTEIEMFSGALIRMAEEKRVPVPFNRYTYLLIKALEEKNDGKFEYEDNTP